MIPQTKLKTKTTKDGKVKFLNLLRNWAHQGFFYLDRTEKLWRIIFEILPLIMVFLLLWGEPLFHCSTYIIVLIILIVIHTSNWVFNNNWWACLLFAIPSLTNPGEEKTILYLNSMADRLKRCSSISGLLVFGSIVRGKWHDKSDLDLRLVRHPGIFNGMAAYFTLVRERIIAVFNKQPLDIYLADGIPFLQKMRSDEHPLFLIKNDPRLDSVYPKGKEIEIERLRQ